MNPDTQAGCPDPESHGSLDVQVYSPPSRPRGLVPGRPCMTLSAVPEFQSGCFDQSLQLVITAISSGSVESSRDDAEKSSAAVVPPRSPCCLGRGDLRSGVRFSAVRKAESPTRRPPLAVGRIGLQAVADVADLDLPWRPADGAGGIGEKHRPLEPVVS